MMGDAFPLKVLRGSRGPQANEPEIDLSPFQRAELFGRRHVEQVYGDMRTGQAESAQRVGDKLEVEVGQIGDIELSSVAAAQALDAADAFFRLREQPFRVAQE